MATEQAKRFTDALHALEERGDVEGMASLFSEQAELRNPTDGEPHRGVQGARDFWNAYRSSFAEIRSDFRGVAEAGDTVMLEWRSQGKLADGSPVDYEGVSVVEFEDGRVRRFRAYFDPAKLSEQVTRTLE